MWLIAGLGNPGADYAKTRHNIGFMVIDALAQRAGLVGYSKQFKAEVARANLRGAPCVLVKPQTYMNLSGESVQPAAAFFKVPLEQLIVVHDDIDLNLGQIKLKKGGGHGGHNGIRSIAGRMGQEFLRVRLGVGRPGGRAGNVAGHVLGGFAKSEQTHVDLLIEEGADAVEMLLTEGLLAAQNRFHARA